MSPSRETERHAKKKPKKSHRNVPEQYKTIDMWRRTGRGGTHVAVFGATGAGVMISFSFATLRTLAITAPTERLCDKNE